MTRPHVRIINICTKYEEIRNKVERCFDFLKTKIDSLNNEFTTYEGFQIDKKSISIFYNFYNTKVGVIENRKIDLLWSEFFSYETDETLELIKKKT